MRFGFLKRTVEWTTSRSGNDARIPTVILFSIVACVLVVDLARGFVHRSALSTPGSDEAVLTLAALDVLDGEPARGAYSRFGWHHPGPMLVHQLTGTLWLSGRSISALPWSIALTNALCFFLGLVLLGRERNASLRAGLLVAGMLSYAAVSRAMAPSVLTMVWNPIAALGPTFLLYCLAWRRPTGRWVLPTLIVVHAYVVQAHVGFALIATFLASCAAVPAIRKVRELERAHSRLTIAATAVAFVFAWWSLARSWPNIVDTFAFFLDRPDRGVTWVDAISVLADRTQAPLLFLFDEIPEHLPLILLGVQVLLMANHLGQRIGRREGMSWPQLAVGCGPMAIAALAALALDHTRTLHQTNWFVLVGAFGWVGALRPLSQRTMVRLGWMGAIAVAAMTIVRFEGEAQQRFESWHVMRDELSRQRDEVVGILEPIVREESVMLEIAPRDHEMWDPAAIIAVGLQERDLHVAIDPRFEFMFGQGRTRCPSPCRRVALSRDRPADARRAVEVGGLHLSER